ncbi:MAG: type II toxin-antitoxin system RelE/ParE family toxin [Okeania sp. SIO2D1]|nr:type II toxin-antitoxin system RelE/ParE family toxin [Okeania sp. SIO2D1]
MASAFIGGGFFLKLKQQKIKLRIPGLSIGKSVPSNYLKKLVNTDNIWEVRVGLGNDIFRFLGFFDNENLIILTNGFAKKTQKTPVGEIELAERRKQDYLSRKKNNE